MNLKKVYRGEIGGVPVITTLKKAMLELFKGYPLFQYYGIFESYFNGIPGQEVVKILEKDKLIEVIRLEGKQPLYRITPEGINMAIAMINLEYSEETKRFTIWIIALTILALLLGLNQLIFTLIT